MVTENAALQIKREGKNGFGETYYVIDNLNNTNQYSYDEYGQSIYAQAYFQDESYSAGVVTLYDSWGRKGEIRAPNMGR